MATTADIKNGAVIIHKNKRMKIIEFQHVKPARVEHSLDQVKRYKIWQDIDETFNAGHKIEFIRVEAKPMQFLY